MKLMERSSITEVNEFLLLDQIRVAGSTNRPELASSLSLSPASVSRIVRRLLDRGLVLEEPGTPGGVGRSPDLLRFNSRAGAVIAIDLGGTNCHGALADLSGDVLHEDLRPTFSGGSPADTLTGAISSLRAAAAAAGLPVAAVSVGIPAVIDPTSGLVEAGPNVDWHGFDLISLLESVLSEPFTVENDVNLAGLGEAWRGGGTDCASFVTLSLGTGIGAAVVLDGQLVRGWHNAAGEIGYLITDRTQLRKSAPGLEGLISGDSLAKRAQAIAETNGQTISAAEVAPASLFRAAADGDGTALEVIDELIDQVAIAVTAVAAVVDPERVILDGSIGRALGPYLGEIDTLVRQAAYRAPELIISVLGPSATVIGAIAAALGTYRESIAPAILSVPAVAAIGAGAPLFGRKAHVPAGPSQP
jgi:glucokinase